MRDKLYLVGFLLVAGLLLFLGRDLIRSSVLIAWGLTFGSTTVVALLVVALYRFRLELTASRQELALKDAELSFALKVQQALFPRDFPTGYGLEFSAVCIPARGISGDYYDVLQLQDGRLVFAIADISGKGISAAILMANLQALLRVVATALSSPAEVCRRVNYHLHQVTDAARFATLFYGEWTPALRRLRYVNAGHYMPLLFGSLRGQSLNDGGIPLGIFPDYPFETGEVILQPNDLMVLYSDGITEAGLKDGNEFGTERLETLVAPLQHRPLQEIQKHVIDTVRSWSRNEPEDDMTFVAVRALAVASEASSGAASAGSRERS